MKNLILSSFVPAALFFGCASAQKVEDTSSAEVTVEVARIIPRNESLYASAVDVVLKIENPGSKPIKLESVDYSVDTGEVAGILEGTAEVGAEVGSEQISEVKFSQPIPFPEDPAKYRALIDQHSFPIDLSGTVTVTNAGDFEFERKSEVATPSLPSFIVFDAQAARYGEGGVDVTIFLRLSNENVFPILIEGLRYTVFIAGKKVKSEQAALGERIIAGAAEEYEVGAVLEGKKWSPEDLRQILSAGKLDYRVEAKVEVKRAGTLTFEHTGEITLAGGD